MTLENGENIFKILTLLHGFERNFMNAVNPTEWAFEMKGKLCEQAADFVEKARVALCGQIFLVKWSS